MTTRVKPISAFPMVTRDLSLVAPLTVTAYQIFSTIKASAGPLLSGTKFFDYFKKDGACYCSIHLFFGSDDHTLTKTELVACEQTIVAALATTLGVVRR